MTGFGEELLTAKGAKKAAKKIFTTKDTKGFTKGTKDRNGFQYQGQSGRREDLAQVCA